MTILVDKDIRELCVPSQWLKDQPVGEKWFPMIEPFSEAVSGGGVISYGLSAAGYDARLSREILRFKRHCGEVINPKRFNDPEYREKVFEEVEECGQVVLAPGDYILAQTLEYFRIPRYLKGYVIGKSTLARCLVLCNCTPLEPSWEGRITLELGNVGPLPCVVFPDEGAVQIEFKMLTREPEKDYKQRGAKYDKQTEVTPARVK